MPPGEPKSPRAAQVELVERSTRRLVVVSNRLPVDLREDDGTITCRHSPGGLVQALAHVLGPQDLWVGTAGSAGSFDVQAEAAAAGLDVGHRMRAVPLTEEDFQDHYLGFSNQIIWPLFHDFHPYCRFRSRYLKAFRRVNTRFAASVAQELHPDDVVWVHDYHLVEVGQHLRAKGWDGPTGFFLHIPFPTPETLVRFPWYKDLVRALLAYDLIGFQTRRDAQNFVRSLQTVEGSGIVHAGDRWEVHHDGRITAVAVHPIGIDAASLQRRAEDPDFQREVARMRRDGMTYLLGLERLDYTKGIPERLEAFHLALQRHPELHGRVTFIQHVDPSREDIARYARLRRRIERLVGQINGAFGTLDWTPVVYSYRHVPYDEVLRLYALADVAVVTPLRDGMNLVAKEFCAIHADNKGVLVLSRFTGAAERLGDDAVLVNPHDVDGVARALYAACTMDPVEQHSRMQALRSQVAKGDVASWAKGFLADLRPRISALAR